MTIDHEKNKLKNSMKMGAITFWFTFLCRLSTHDFVKKSNILITATITETICRNRRWNYRHPCWIVENNHDFSSKANPPIHQTFGTIKKNPLIRNWKIAIWKKEKYRIPWCEWISFLFTNYTNHQTQCWIPSVQLHFVWLIHGMNWNCKDLKFSINWNVFYYV